MLRYLYLLFLCIGPRLVLGERIGTAKDDAESGQPTGIIGGAVEDEFIPTSLAGQRTATGEEDDLVLEDEYDGRVVRRFHSLVLADHAAGKPDSVVVEHASEEVVYQAFDARGSHSLGARYQHGLWGAAVPLLATPLVVAAGLKGKILGIKGANGSELLPGAGTLRYYDAVDGKWQTVKLSPEWYKSKKMVGAVMGLLGLSIAGLTASVVASKREKSRLGLLGGPGTALWDVSDCILLVDIAQAEKLKHIYGNYVPGSATITVDLLLQRARLRYAEKPPLLGNVIKRILGKTVSRSENFRLSTEHCYLRHSFRPRDGCTNSAGSVAGGSAPRGASCTPLAPAGVFFRELFDSKGKHAEALAIHLHRNPGWVRTVEDPSLDSAAVARDLDWNSLSHLSAPEPSGESAVLEQETPGSSRCKGSEACEQANPDSVLFWAEEIGTDNCRIVAALRGHGEVAVWANYADQQLFIGTDKPTASDFNRVRRLPDKCLLLEEEPPRYSMTRVEGNQPVGDTSAPEALPGTDVLIDGVEDEAATAPRGYPQSEKTENTRFWKRAPVLNAEANVGGRTIEDASHEEVKGLAGCSGRACSGEGARPSGESTASRGHGLASTTVLEGGEGFSAAENASVFIIETRRKLADWPKQVEIPKGEPGKVSS